MMSLTTRPEGAYLQWGEAFLANPASWLAGSQANRLAGLSPTIRSAHLGTLGTRDIFTPGIRTAELPEIPKIPTGYSHTDLFGEDRQGRRIKTTIIILGSAPFSHAPMNEPTEAQIKQSNIEIEAILRGKTRYPGSALPDQRIQYTKHYQIPKLELRIPEKLAPPIVPWERDYHLEVKSLNPRMLNLAGLVGMAGYQVIAAYGRGESLSEALLTTGVSTAVFVGLQSGLSWLASAPLERMGTRGLAIKMAGSLLLAGAIGAFFDPEWADGTWGHRTTLFGKHVFSDGLAFAGGMLVGSALSYGGITLIGELISTARFLRTRQFAQAGVMGLTGAWAGHGLTALWNRAVSDSPPVPRPSDAPYHTRA